MNTKDSNIDLCAICGEKRVMTFEHIPPKSAFNNNPIFIQRHEHLIDRTSYLYGKKSKLNNGFGIKSLCSSCNNNTGQWYANDYKNFAIQADNYFNSYDGVLSSHKVDFEIKPLNVIKQIMAMFFSVNHNSGVFEKDVVEFMLNRYEKKLSSKYQVYMYFTYSPHKRLNGFQFIREASGENVICSEFNFQPFGFVLTSNSKPPNHFMANITKFTEFDFNQSVKLFIIAPYLDVKGTYNGTYNNIPK